MKSQDMAQGTRERLAFLDNEYERIVRDREILRASLSIYERDIAAEGDARSAPKPPTQAKILTDAMYEVLLEDQPLHRKEILNGVKGKGVVITAKDVLRSVTLHLSQDQRFESVGNGEWQLVGHSKPDAPNATRMRLIK